jgi:hypothetical protein
LLPIVVLTMVASGAVADVDTRAWLQVEIPGPPLPAPPPFSGWVAPETWVAFSADLHVEAADGRRISRGRIWLGVDGSVRRELSTGGTGSPSIDVANVSRRQRYRREEGASVWMVEPLRDPEPRRPPATAKQLGQRQPRYEGFDVIRVVIYGREARGREELWAVDLDLFPVWKQRDDGGTEYVTNIRVGIVNGDLFSPRER